MSTRDQSATAWKTSRNSQMIECLDRCNRGGGGDGGGDGDDDGDGDGDGVEGGGEGGGGTKIRR